MPIKKNKKAAVKKTAKKAIKKTAPKKKVAAKKATKKVIAKKAIKKAIKKTVKKAAPKVKAKAAKKTTAKKATPKKSTKKVAKKPAKKAAPKKVIKKPAKKVTKKPAKKTPPKKVTKKAVKKPAKKTAAKKVAKKTTAKKPSAKKATPKAVKKTIKKATPEPVKTKQKPQIKQEPAKTQSKAAEDDFAVGDYVIYPSHGIGKIIEIEDVKIMDSIFNCYLIYFEKERMTIKVPAMNAKEIKLRHIVDKRTIEEVFAILRSGVKKMKGMWSRRAQEYEAKINSGEIFALAEVLRDLARDIEDGDRSYSERIIYETAITRLACEYAAIYSTTLEEAKEIVINTSKDKLNCEPKNETETLSKKIKLDDDEEEDGDEDEEAEEDDFDDFDDFDD